MAMYKEICDFVRNHNLPAPLPNYSPRDISGYIVLDGNGNYERIEVLNKPVKKIIRDKNNEQTANVACEKAAYILDMPGEKCTNHNKYVSWVKTMLSGEDSCDIMQSVCCFIKKFDEDFDFREMLYQDFMSSGLKDTSFISFMVDGVCIEDAVSDWDEWFCSLLPNTETDTIYSSISGARQKACPPTKAPCVSIFGKKIALAAVNFDSYESYDLKKSSTLQIGIDDANMICAFFTFANANDDYSSRDFQLVYFYDKDVDNAIKMSLNFDDDDDDDISSDEIDIIQHKSVVSDMLSAIKTGKRFVPLCDDSARYYMYQLIIYDGKICRYCMQEKTGKYKTLLENLYKWYSDTSLITTNGIKSITKLYNVFLSCCSNAHINSNKAIGDIFKSTNAEFKSMKYQLLESVYEGKQIPHTLYTIALDKIVSAISTGTKRSEVNDPELYNINCRICSGLYIDRTIWFQIVKCYLLRTGKEYSIMSEVNTVNTAYACGQMFAVYEQMQRRYFKEKKNSGLNKNLAQCYFSAALKQPAVIFAQLADLAIVYMNRIEYASIYIKILGEIAESIGETFPDKFTETDKGSFVLGYYQQKAAFLNEAIAANEAQNESDESEEGE